MRTLIRARRGEVAGVEMLITVLTENDHVLPIDIDGSLPVNAKQNFESCS